MTEMDSAGDGPAAARLSLMTAPADLVGTAARDASAHVAWRPQLAFVGVAFFVSGAAGLVYQVAWQRILALQSGIGIYSVAMIVAAFMAGIGVGSHLGGILSLRVDARQALRRFVVVELGIAIFGAASTSLYYDFLYAKASWLYASAWIAGLLHFASLFVPTTLMGMSLPFLVRAFVAETRSAGRTIGFLYGMNLLGASAGSFVAPWFLIRFLGIRGAVLAAAAGNLTAALLALSLGRFMRPEAEAAEQPPEPDAPARATDHPFALWVALYASSGFCALSLEIVWFRLLDLAVKSTAFTFGTLLWLYLTGSAVGCFVGALLATRLKRPLRAFLLCECVLLAYSGLAIVLLVSLPAHDSIMGWFVNYWGRGGGVTFANWNWPAVRRLYFWLPVTLFGLPTILMGLAFPILQRAVHHDVRSSGHRVGILQAANIVGCVAGSLLVGLVAIGWLGSTGSLRLLMACGVIFALVGWRAFRGPLFAAFALLLAAVSLAVPSQQRLWARLHGVEAGAPLLDEDATSVGALVPRGRGWAVFVNGRNHSWIPFGGVHTQLGALPAVMHRAPLDVAIIGLGSGNTAWASACRPETRSISVFELSAPQPRLLRRLAQQADLPELRSFLADPRVRIRVTDGRSALNHSPDLYDIIEADAIWPDVAYSGNLYSTEYFARCAAKLKPGGLMCTWAPTRRILASFLAVFPHVVGPEGRDILVGSLEPIPVMKRVWRARLQNPEIRSYLGDEGVGTVDGLIQGILAIHRTRPIRITLNEDLYPRDEFVAP